MASPAQELLPLGQVKFETSPTIGKIADAAAKARKVFKPVIKDKINPFYKAKYADLDSVIDATKDGLSDNGLAVFQAPMYTRGGDVQIMTLLAHSSGEWIKTILDVPAAKVDAQGIGAATTYGRRYAYGAMVNVASEEDDDANGAVSQPFKKPVKEETNEEFDQRTEGERNIPLFKVNAIKEACLRTKKTEAEALTYLNLLGEKRIEDLKNNQFDEFLKWANSTPKKADADPAKDDLPRKKAMATLFAVAAKNGVPENDLKQLTYEKYKVNSMTKLTTEQLVEVRQWVESVAAQHVEQ